MHCLRPLLCGHGPGEYSVRVDTWPANPKIFTDRSFVERLSTPDVDHVGISLTNLSKTQGDIHLISKE